MDSYGRYKGEQTHVMSGRIGLGLDGSDAARAGRQCRGGKRPCRMEREREQSMNDVSKIDRLVRFGNTGSIGIGGE